MCINDYYTMYTHEQLRPHLVDRDAGAYARMGHGLSDFELDLILYPPSNLIIPQT